MIQGFLKENIDKYRVSFFVGAEDKDRKYDGPIAEVSYDKNWLYIYTDKYEGRAMLNIEALPYLRQALENIALMIEAAE